MTTTTTILLFVPEELINMRRRERAVTADIRLDVDSEEKLSNMSPIFAHRMINLSPLFNIRSNNSLVRA